MGVHHGYPGRGKSKYKSLESAWLADLRNIKDTDGQNESVSKR